MKIILVSGGFDPLHVGHVRLFKEARKLGQELVVLINNDNWLKKKKGYNFMEEQDRKEIIEHLDMVDEVIISNHEPNTEDMSICEDIKKIMPDVFANGGDRSQTNIPEKEMCAELGIELVDNVGGDKIRSAQELVKNAHR